MKQSLLEIIDRLYSGTVPDFRRRRLTNDQLQLIFTPNPEQCVLADESDEFRKNLLSADILLADGVGLSLASKLRGKNVPRITGVDTLKWWLGWAKEEKASTLLLGGRDGVAESLAKWYDPEGEWCWGIPGHVNVAAAKDPQFKEQLKREEKEIFDVIEKKRPKALFVAFGAPWQEEFLCRHREKLNRLGVKLAMVCGGSFDYLTGRVKRAPVLLRILGLEWFYRLVKEPWRWRRQLRLIRFLWLLV